MARGIYREFLASKGPLVSPGPDGYDIRVPGHPEPLSVKSSLAGTTAHPTLKEWEAYDLTELVAAIMCLCSDVIDLVDPDSTPSDASVTSSWSPRGAASINSERLTLSEVLDVARSREQIRKAVLAYAAGGAGGWFEAYEAAGSEIMNSGVLNYDADVGTREWMVTRGWITQEEDDLFLRTVQYVRSGGGRTLPHDLLSPYHAQLFIRKVLSNLIRYYASSGGNANTAGL